MPADKYKKRDTNHGLVCRREAGGCGRPVVIVETARDIVAFGLLRGVRSGTRAVHADEAQGLPVAKASRYTAINKRKELEQSCVGRRERGEI